MCFAAMEFGQQTLPFKKVVKLANGQVAISLAPIKPSMWSGFACQLCKLTFKTKQALAGHKTSLLHKGRMGDQTRRGQDLNLSFSQMSFQAEMMKWGQTLQKLLVPGIVPLTISQTTTLTSEQGRLQSWVCLSL